MKNYQKIGILADIHFPYEDTRKLNEALSILKNEKPDCIIADGDILDFPKLSRYGIVPDFHKKGIHDELSLGWSFFSDLRKEHPNADIYYIEGNHEFRFKSYPIRLSPEMYSLVSLPEMLKLHELGVKWIGTKEGIAKWTDTYVNIGGVLIGHWDKALGSGAGMTVRNLMQKKGNFNIVQAHVHRAALIHFTDIEGNTTWGLETPCLCKDPYWSGAQNWQRGLSIIEKKKDKWIPRLIVL